MHRLIPILIVVGLVICGCSEESPSPERPSASAEKSTVQETQPALAKTSLPVSIIPKPATADGCLKALAGGSPEASYLWEVNGLTIGPASNLLCEGFARGDEVTVTITAGRTTGRRSVTIENAPPRITEVDVNVDALLTRDDLVVQTRAVDADGDPIELRYQWHVNGYSDPFLMENSLPAHRYGRGDEIAFSITPSDGVADGPEYRSETLTIPNAPPQIVSMPPQQFEALEYSYQVEALDPDGDPLFYALAEAPPGMSIDQGAGLIRWPLAGVVPGNYPLKVVVTDPDGAAAFQEFSFSLGKPNLH